MAILTPAELRSLPAGRAVLLVSGTPPVLVRAVPWWDGDQAAAVRASLEAAARCELETATDLLANAEPENIYPDVFAFVVDYLAPLYARQWQAGREPRWCARWWEHPEAVVRLTALWLAWEAARLQPGGVLGWFRDADADMDRLAAERGTFAQCAPDRHKAAPALFTDATPAGSDLTQL